MFFTFTTSKITFRTNNGKHTKGASIGFEITPTEDRQILEIDSKYVLTSDGLYGLYYKKDEWIRIKPSLNIYIEEDADESKENYPIGQVFFSKEHEGEMEYFPATLDFNLRVNKEDFYRIEKHAIYGTPSISFTVEALDQSGEILEYGWEPDGSRKKWKFNENNRRHSLEIIEFNFSSSIQKSVEQIPSIEEKKINQGQQILLHSRIRTISLAVIIIAIANLLILLK